MPKSRTRRAARLKKRSTDHRLQIVDICGCGKCPTVILRSTPANFDRAARGQQLYATPWDLPS